MASEWDAHTSLTAAGDGLFGAELDPGWVVGGGVNGGYLLGLIGKAIAETVPAKPHPLSVSAYYLSASSPGPAQVSTRVLREGGSVATVAAELGQEGTTRITALATYGDLRAMPDDVADDRRRARRCRRSRSASRARWRPRRCAGSRR